MRKTNQYKKKHKNGDIKTQKKLKGNDVQIDENYLTNVQQES